MANPSLQIGNSNWAIKEDNLLGYSTAGTRFLPQPITMTRASAGTRVNPQGLVETVELLGSELVVNGGFINDTNWIKSPSGVTITGSGFANFTSGQDTYVFQAIMTIGKSYSISLDYNITSISTGYFGSNFGSGSAILSMTGLSGSGTLSGVIVATSDLLIIRSSTFDGTITNVSAKEVTRNNLARVDYDGTASSLLVEPQRTNDITYSEDFTNAIWTNTAAAISVNPTADLSPDGTLSGNEFNEGTSSNRRALFEDLSVTANQIHTLSVFVKKGTSDYFRLVIAENGDATNWTAIQVDLSDNSLSTNNGNNNSFTDISSAISSTDYNGYYRLQLTAKHSTVTSLRLLFCTSNGTPIASGNSYGRLDYTGTSKTVFVWGAQLEEGSYATSYIPTSGSTVTRVQEQYEKTGISNLINSEEGVLFVESKALANDGTFRYIALSDGSNNERIQIIYSSTANNIAMSVVSSNSGQASFTAVISQTQYNKIAIKYKENDCSFWLNGVKIHTDTSATMPSGLDILGFERPTGVSQFFGKVKQLQVFKTALTDTELATLTTI